MLAAYLKVGDFMKRKTASLALAALATALGSTAFADPWVDNAGAPRQHAAPPPGVLHTSYDIVVNKFGSRIRGSKTTTSSQVGTGTYIAEFPVDVTNCVYVATLGRGTRIGGADEAPGYVTVVRSAVFSAGVFVQTFGLKGVLRNRPFHLLVAC
jgi:hypothetical protein